MEVVVVKQTYTSKTGEIKETTYLAISVNGKYIRIKPVYDNQVIEIILNAKKVEIDLC